MIADFLSTIWGEGDWLGEIRYINQNARSRFFPISDTAGAAEFAVKQDELGGFDSYFGVVPRITSRGTADNCISDISVLWADVDAKHTGGKFTGLAGIRMARIRPSIIVDSGHGFHCYWLLRSPATWDQAHLAMKGLAREVRGDAVYDKPRILRVPGTHNRKELNRTLPVRLVYWDTERRHRITDFDLDLPPVYPTHPVAVERVLDLPPWLAERITEGAPKGLRSEASFSVVLWMLRYGHSEDEIREVFRSTEIGEKYREKGNGDRWLNQTIRAARAAQ